MENKQPLRSWPVTANLGQRQSKKDYADPDLDEVWRLAVALDLGSRSVFEAEVLMWRICNEKSLSLDATRRALNQDWE